MHMIISSEKINENAGMNALANKLKYHIDYDLNLSCLLQF